MARVTTYLNFAGNTEEAFNFYASVFGTAISDGVVRFGDMEGMPPLSDSDKTKILHMELPIVAGHIIMATDVLESMGHSLVVGNNTTINLEVDTREEADRLFGLLGKDSTEFAPMNAMPWGQYWGSALDRFGIRWMFTSPL